jgi:serine/threonine-protein kinase HipA
MAKNNIISLFCFGKEIGRIGLNLDSNSSTFQYNPEFINSGQYSRLFPYIFKKTHLPQRFSNYNSETFRGLPPMIADSLPDVFGNIIFKTWLELQNKDFKKITVLEQLAYVGNRGMGALEYRPNSPLPKDGTINLEEITEVLTKVLDQKNHISGDELSAEVLLNIFKIGSSAGGARPKILVSQHKQSGKIIPGDLEYSGDYDHYLIKLNIPEEGYRYNREAVEYSYYLTAVDLGITMMPSKLIENKHFATLRYDRQQGTKKHVLTASGMAGWDFKSPNESSYENLFELALSLKLPPRQIDELFKRMVFNVVFFNIDDHLKNHSFIYNGLEDNWDLAPAYDLTYALNPLLRATKVNRVLSINGKRTEVTIDDILRIADQYTVKQPKQTIQSVQNAIPTWEENARNLGIPDRIIGEMKKDFIIFPL